MMGKCGIQSSSLLHGSFTLLAGACALTHCYTEVSSANLREQSGRYGEILLVKKSLCVLYVCFCVCAVHMYKGWRITLDVIFCIVFLSFETGSLIGLEMIN